MEKDTWIDVDGGRIYLGDAIDLIKSLPEESVDLCITDFPYESLEKWRKMGTTTRLKKSKSSSNAWFKTFPNELYFSLLTELFRVMKKGTHVYLFCDEETRDVILSGTKPKEGFSYGWEKSPMAASGFRYWKTLIWKKEGGIGMGYHYRAGYEMVMLLEKMGKKSRRLNDLSTTDVLSAKFLKGKKFYPTEKPEVLFWKFITQSSEEGDVCLDPFMGSGVCASMAKKTNRRFIVGDLSEQSVKTALTRLKT